MTKLDRPLRREIEIDALPYTLTLYPHTLKLARKGQRRSIEFSWDALLKLAEHGQSPSACTPCRAVSGATAAHAIRRAEILRVPTASRKRR